MKKIVVIFAIILVPITGLMAQSKHEVSVNGGLGLSSLQYSYGDAKHSMGFGGFGGLGYQFSFTPHLDIRTGIDFAFYNAKSTAGQITGNEDVSSELEFSYTYTNYEEKASATLLNIPVMVQYQGIANTPLYGALGVKIGIPMSSSANVRGNLHTKGFNPITRVTFEDDLPAYGFGPDLSVNQDDDLSLNVAIMLAVELGAKWKLGEKQNLYTCLYFDYGLNNINKDSAESLVGYQNNTPSELTYSSMTGSSDKLSPLAFGAVVRLSLGL